ncbi:unnamed protein product [Ilex paraguariensis]|uniref:Uncharacterized protein n=1 Tax=Ilex paraguariensis TaxID=185542 RepID=A0ABC8TXN4_9AQUA
MSTASAGLAEVYVTKKLYKEKMKRMENEEAQKKNYASPDHGRKSNSGGGFFSTVFKKIHPAAMPSSDSSMGAVLAKVNKGSMSTTSAALAEVHVMKKLYKDKMKRMETENAQKEAYDSPHHGRKSTSGGCFSMMFKKIHPAGITSSDSAGEAVFTKAN